MRRGLAYFMTIVMMIGMLLGVPATTMEVEAATTTITAGGLSLSGESLSSSDYEYDSTTGKLTIKSDKAMSISGTAAKAGTIGLDYIYIASGVNANLTLNGVTIDWNTNSRYGSGIEIAEGSTGNVTITLVGKNVIRGNRYPAIQKNGSGSVGKLIFKGNGSLTAYTKGGNSTDYSSAAIGGASGKDGSNIQFDGGTFSVTSACDGAAIGGGYNGDGSNIIVNDGTNMTAKVTDTTTAGAAIGGGAYGVGTGIVINGGEVTATGGGDAAAIGSGAFDTSDGSSSIATDVTINGGIVTATGGGTYGAGIGSGNMLVGNTSNQTTVTIAGGTIVANGGSAAPGVGAGDYANVKVYISGGSLRATGGATSSSTYTGENVGRGIKSNFDSSQTSTVVYSVSNPTAVKERELTGYDANTNMEGKLKFTLNGAEYNYGLNDVQTDASGNLYLYLHEDVLVSNDSSGGSSGESDAISAANIAVKYNGSETKQDWYTGSVTITADGYTFGTNQNGTNFKNQLTINGTYSNSFYFMDANGRITSDSKLIFVNIDTTKPSGTLSLDGKTYSTLNGTTGVSMHKLSDTTVTLKDVSDSGSGIASKDYAFASTCYSTASNIEAANLSWTAYSSTISFPSNDAKAVYVRIKDVAGNTTYISTPVIYHDTTAPTSTVVISDVTSTSAVASIEISDVNQTDYAFVLLPSSRTAPTSWSGLVALISDSNGGQGTGSSVTKTFTGLTPGETYKLYVTAKDNLTSLSGSSNSNIRTPQTKTTFTTPKKKATVSNQEYAMKAGVTTNSYTYNLKQILASSGISEADIANFTYSYGYDSGNIISGTLSEKDGVLTIPVHTNLAENLSQTIHIQFLNSHYETISMALVLKTISKTPVSLSGVSVPNAVYDEKGHGYTGTIEWKDEDGTVCVGAAGTDVTYVGVTDPSYNKATAPTGAGTYNIVFEVKSSNGEYIGKKTYTFTIEKADLSSEMENVFWYMDGSTKITSSSYSVVKDGNSHTVSVKGISDKLQVSYGGTCTASAIGSYEAVANFTVASAYATNYKLQTAMSTKTLNWSIADKVTPDMSQVAWVYKQGTTQETYEEGITKLIATGSEYTVAVVGLPTGVSARYSGICTAKDVGSYTAMVTFNVTDSDKYNVPTPSTMTLVWCIEEAQSSDEEDDNNNASGNNDNKTENDTDNNTQNGESNDSTETNTLPIGRLKEVGGATYKVTSSSATTKTVEYTKPTGKKSSLKSAKIPAKIVIDGETYTVTSIAKDAFSGYKKLTSVTIPKGITSIGANAFKKCTSLKKVTIPNTVSTIGSSAFYGCSALKTVTIQSSCQLKKISDKAFYQCAALTKITIPKNVTTIGKQSFYGCKKLKTITIKSKKLKTVGSKAIKGIYKKATIKCPNKTYVIKYKKLFKSKTGFVKTMKIK